LLFVRGQDVTKEQQRDGEERQREVLNSFEPALEESEMLLRLLCSRLDDPNLQIRWRWARIRNATVEQIDAPDDVARLPARLRARGRADHVIVTDPAGMFDALRDALSTSQTGWSTP
jgi:hypothetical protein